MQMDAFPTTCSGTTNEVSKLHPYFGSTAECTHKFPCMYRFPLCDMSEIRSDRYAGALTGYSGPRA